MRHTILFVIFFIVTGFLFAQSIQLSFAPSVQYYNTLRAASFDTSQPSLQPFLTAITISVAPGQTVPFKLNTSFVWNNSSVLSTKLQAKSNLHSGTHVLTNRDVLVENGNNYFNKPNPSLSFQEIEHNNPALYDALTNTGLFPDGQYSITIQALDMNDQPISNEAQFSFVVQNANSIYLALPGIALGSSPSIPTVNNTSLNFLWSSNLQFSQTPFHLTLKEFDQLSQINENTIEYNGRVVLNQDVPNITYTANVPLQSMKYYVWQVSIPLRDEYTGGNSSAPQILKSPWFIFQYNPQGTSQYTVLLQQIQNILTQLGSPQLTEILTNYQPTGMLWINGQPVNPDQIMQIIQELTHKQITNIHIED